METLNIITPRKRFFARSEQRSFAFLACSATILFFVGVLLRYQFIFVWNRPTAQENLFSDMLYYFTKSETVFDAAEQLTIDDTIYPPGTAYYFGFLRLLDPSLELIPKVQFILSCALPLIVAAIAFRLWGKRCSLVALGFTSLYFPCWEYFGFICSEGPFSIGLLVSFYFLVLSLQSGTNLSSSLWAFGSGLILAASASLKSASLVSAALVFAGMCVLRFFGPVRIRTVILGALPGMCVILVPLAIRATHLNDGRFLLIANDGARGFLIGHHGRIGRAIFNDPTRGRLHDFVSPTAFQRQYPNTETFPFGAYDSAPQYALGLQWIRNNPTEAALQSVEHVFDLFQHSLSWPGAVKRYYSWVVFFQQIFLVFVLFPVAYFIVRCFNDMRQDPSRFAGEYLALLAAVSIYAVAFFFVGEPRYRVPYDGFMILLACRTISRSEGKGIFPSSAN